MSIKLPFIKMQVLGNDFILIEENHLKAPLTPSQIRSMADRRLGMGCDQLILLQKSSQADIKVSFYNADGSEAQACGNGTRCVAKYLNKDSGSIATPSFLSHFNREGDEITLSLKPPIFLPPHPQGYQIDIGNPHLVIFTEKLESIPLPTLAPSLQPPEGINVEVAEVVSQAQVKIKIWERGVGLTPACGTGACAVGILALKLGFIKKPPVFIEMDGGVLKVSWTEGEPPLSTGPAEICFEGLVELP